jgi:hypothetical protein
MFRRDSAVSIIWRENEALRPRRPRKLRSADARLVLLCKVKRTCYPRKLRNIVNRDRFGDDAAAEAIRVNALSFATIRLER